MKSIELCLDHGHWSWNTEKKKQKKNDDEEGQKTRQRKI